MNSKKLRKQVLLAWAGVLGVLAAITVGTYAWFTFSAVTNVAPMSSTISDGNASLLISDQPNGPFDRTCPLVFTARPDTLGPLSTADLSGFYRTIAQNADGISILYQDATARADEYLMRGTLYLQSTGGTNTVYFLPSAFTLGADAQTMGALRLGMRISRDGQEQQFIFRLDGLSGGGAAATVTVPTAGTVVRGIDGSGSAAYTADPSEDITTYMAAETTGAPRAGAQSLCTLADGQIATVEYWIYLEGCDENCITAVQSRDIPIQLGFAGVVQEVQ